MHRPRRATSLPALLRLLGVLALAAAGLAGAALPARAADSLTIEASALLGGHVRTGGWAGVVVNVTNDGPDVRGELRIRSSQQGRSIYAVEADLPSGARKEFVLYTQPPVFGSRLVVELVAGDTSLHTSEVTIRMTDPYRPLIGIVAERPEAFQRDVLDALRNPNFNEAAVVLLRPEDMPTRVEVLATLDRLIWQDVDTGRLSAEQVAALELWLSAGGQLVIAGGSAGPGVLGSLPAEMLPFVPQRTVDVAPSDLDDLVGTPPDGAGSLPALAGTLRAGSILGRSGDSVYAARLGVGQGSVTIIGLDPGSGWLARSDAAQTLWRRALPSTSGHFQSPFFLPDESSIFQNALYNLPSVALPPIEQLFVLLLAYIALIGPINYLVLRRLDRREWAWLTMPVLVAVFAVGSYGLGAALKGSDVIVNEVAIVRAGQGATRGVGQVYIGVFSPSRRTFDVRVPGGALLSSPYSQAQFGQTEQPIDALLGDSVSRLRNFEVGFGVIRGFRADTPVAAPSVTADLRLVGGRIVGSVTNSSDAALEHVGVVFANTAIAIPNLGPGQTSEVNIQLQGGNVYPLSDRIFGTAFSRDPALQREITTRRAVIDQLTGYGPTVIGATPDTALLIGWQDHVALDVEIVGERPNHVGNSLYVIPLSVAYDRQAVFEDPLIVRTLVDQGAEQGWGEANSWSLGRGTMTLELRPAGISQPFRATSLTLALSMGMVGLHGPVEPVEPLPDSEQPPQDDPLGEPTADCFQPPCGDTGGLGDPPAGGGGAQPGGGQAEPDDEAKPEAWPMGEHLPAVQVFDHAAGRWYELPAFAEGRSYSVREAQRWVDPSGRVLLRFVNRAEFDDVRWFSIAARLEGTLE